MKSSSGYFIVVIEDVALEKVVGAATLLVERKFIHECGQVVIIIWMYLFKYSGRTYPNIVAVLIQIWWRLEWVQVLYWVLSAPILKLLTRHWAFNGISHGGRFNLNINIQNLRDHRRGSFCLEFSVCCKSNTEPELKFVTTGGRVIFFAAM